jgi:hypothetical protein
LSTSHWTTSQRRPALFSQGNIRHEFSRITFRKRIYATIEQLQGDLDRWIAEYHQVRPHQGRWCYGKTPMQTFLDTLPIAKEKSITTA